MNVEDLTMRLAAADIVHGHKTGDGPASPEYIRYLADQVAAFAPTWSSFEEYGVRWHTDAFVVTEGRDTQNDAREFVHIIDPDGNGRAEVVHRTVTRSEWQPVAALTDSTGRA